MKGKGGFSLAEFIIGLFLLLVLIAGSLLLLRPAKNIWFEGEKTVSSQTESRNLIAFLTRLISGAILVTDLGKNRPEFLGFPDNLSFCSPIQDSEKETDLARLEIFFNKEEETLYVSEERINSTKRSFSPPDKKGTQPLAFGITRMEFFYFDGTDFQSTWDTRKDTSEENRLPKAVRVNFQLSSPVNKEGKRPADDFEAFIELKNSVLKDEPPPLPSPLEGED
ncbi:MAG: hypothetical protein V2A65_02800 [Candidatus Omnitrophota bacterium]